MKAKKTVVLSKSKRQAKKTATPFSLLTQVQKHILAQRNALLAHTHKTFQTDRNSADRKSQIAALRAFDKRNPFIAKYLAAKAAA